MRFEIPSICAALLQSGEVDIGLVPAIELERQAIHAITRQGIASRGPVRTILLISKVPPQEIRTLAADRSSRTSVVLAQIWLRARFGVKPLVSSAGPDAKTMLVGSDACLVIGDPALRIDPAAVDGQVFDLGDEWTRLTGLPMVFAVWAARDGFDSNLAENALRDSWLYGRERIGEIVAAEAPSRGVNEALAREYLTRHIRFEIDAECDRGLAKFRAMARSEGLA